MKTSEKIDELAAALAGFQKIVGSPKKSAENPAFKREGKSLKYADLDAIIKVITPALSENGLSQMQFTSSDIEMKTVTVNTMLLHSSGQFMISDDLVLPAENFGKFNAQTIGSSITYGRRYSLSAMLGIASEDDDDANTQSLPDNKSGKEAPNNKLQPTNSDNDFFKNKKEVEDRIRAVATKTGSTFEVLKKYVIDKSNEQMRKDFKDFNSSNLPSSMGYVKVLETKANNQPEVNNQPESKQGAMLDDMTNQPAQTVNWGNR